MKIYVLFVEYEVIDLVTTDKQKLIDRVKVRKKLGPGDMVEVWESDKKIADYYKEQDLYNALEKANE